MSEKANIAAPVDEPGTPDTSNTAVPEQDKQQVDLFNNEVNNVFDEIMPELDINPQPNGENEPEGEPEGVPEGDPEGEPEGDSPVDDEILKKRISDKDAMIARQGNEVGELRKEVRDLTLLMQEKKEASLPQKQLSKEEILISASEDEIADALVKDSGNEISHTDALYQAKIIKGSLNAAENLVSKRMAPLLEQHENAVLKNNFEKSETMWMKDHSEFMVRKPVIEKIIANAYPDGISNSIDPYKNSEQFFGILTVAYAAAGDVIVSAKKNVASGERNRVISQRNVNTSSSASSRAPVPKKAKVSAIDAEIENVLGQFEK